MSGTGNVALTIRVQVAIIFTVKMMATYTRQLTLPDRSFFLFGPRGTGKTTWLRHQLPKARWFDLVTDREMLALMRDPERFTAEVEALPSGSWIVIDEVQRLPALLNDVQDLIARHPRRFRFALTGSSARKLKREQANLLAARVVNRRFFPLTAAELGDDFDAEAVLRYGSLPAVANEHSMRGRIDLLQAYVDNYIGQEIRAEALIRRLDSFHRFLEVAAIANAQVTNLAGIGRDAAVARPTVQGYFDVLVDTLIGSFLPAWRARAKVKEVAHPKFYFFDTGVVRALAGRVHEPLSDAERGHLLETYVLHELRAYMNRAGTGGQLAYWRTPSGAEIDFIWTRAGRSVGIEVKATTQWRREDARALEELTEEGVLSRSHAVYLGRVPLKSGGVSVQPLARFLADLQGGAIIG